MQVAGAEPGINQASFDTVISRGHHSPRAEFPREERDYDVAGVSQFEALRTVVILGPMRLESIAALIAQIIDR